MHPLFTLPESEPPWVPRLESIDRSGDCISRSRCMMSLPKQGWGFYFLGRGLRRPPAVTGPLKHCSINLFARPRATNRACVLRDLRPKKCNAAVDGLSIIVMKRFVGHFFCGFVKEMQKSGCLSGRVWILLLAWLWLWLWLWLPGWEKGLHPPCRSRSLCSLAARAEILSSRLL